MSHRAASARCRLGSCRLGWIVVTLVLIVAGPSGCATTGRLSQASVYFHTLPPGYETWLNSMPRGSQYHQGDAWGCLGAWFSGQWRNPPALGYIAQVKKYLREKIWLKPNFR
jgi:hypothetical protein